MNAPKFKHGQMVYNTRVDRGGMVVRIEWSPGSQWLYSLLEDDLPPPESGGYFEDVLSEEKTDHAEPKKVSAVKVDLSSIDAWMGEAAKMIPAEEGDGFQPTIDRLNHITEHINGMTEAIKSYCEFTKLPSPF